MSLPKIQPGTNGKHEAPQEAGGAFQLQPLWEAPAAVQRRPARTEFPAPIPANSMRTWLYGGSRHQFGSIPLTRWIILLCLALALLWLTGLVPGRWFGVALWVGLAVVAGLSVRLQRRTDFIRFFDATAPGIKPAAMSPDDKLPVYVTGLLTVEGEYSRFTFIPGFYRTFATREHALLCQQRAGRFAGVARWPDTETHMWYVFFDPYVIAGVRWGKILFDRTLRPAVAVDYRITVPSKGRLQREKEVVETVYIVAQREEDARRIWRDIQVDLTQPDDVASLSPPQGQGA